MLVKLRENKICFFVAIISSLFISIILCLNLFDEMSFWGFPLVYLAVFAIFLLSIFPKHYECNQKTEKKPKKWIWIVCFALIVLGQIIYFLAYFPGGFNLDAYGQWLQVHGDMQLDNWHPVITTFIYWILTRLIDNLWFCILFQIVLFSLAISLLIKRIIELGCAPFFALFFAMVIAINPAIGMNNVCLVKDIYFTIDIIFIICFLIDIYSSDGKWIESSLNIGKLVFVSIMGIMIRHNGVLLVVPLLVCIGFCYKKYLKNIVMVCITVIVFICVIEGPVYSFLKVKPHSNIVGESVGIPMTIMINAYLNDSGVPKDVSTFLEDLADREQWEGLYILGEWDSCRWELGGADFLNDRNYMEIIRLAIETVNKCPEAAYDSVRATTQMTWQLFGKVYWQPCIYIEDGAREYGIRENNVEYFRGIIRPIENISYNPFASIFLWNTGVILVVLLVLSVIVAEREENKKLIFVIPILAYVFLTTCFLSGPNFRYFYFLEVVILPIAYLLIHKDCISRP